MSQLFPGVCANDRSLTLAWYRDGLDPDVDRPQFLGERIDLGQTGIDGLVDPTEPADEAYGTLPDLGLRHPVWEMGQYDDVSRHLDWAFGRGRERTSVNGFGQQKHPGMDPSVPNTPPKQFIMAPRKIKECGIPSAPPPENPPGD